jgi:hypothetical protein
VLFAVPNGGKRGLREAVKLKREGVRKGAPDLVLITLSPVNNKPTMIEMKSKSGRYSPEQLSMHQLALRSGWNVLAPPRNESARWVICQLELLGY